MNTLDSVYRQLRSLRGRGLTQSEAWAVIRSCGVSYIPLVVDWIGDAFTECDHDHERLERCLPRYREFVPMTASVYSLFLREQGVTPPVVFDPNTFFNVLRAAGCLNRAYARIAAERRPVLGIVPDRLPYGDLRTTIGS